jgi:glutamate synthase domain-containing protein 3
MSGGIAYVYDEDEEFATRCNMSMVSTEKVLDSAEQTKTIPQALWHQGQTDEAQLKQMLESHHKWTGSKRARDLLDNWSVAMTKFVKVFPNEYKRALGEMAAKPIENEPTKAVKSKKAVALK